MTTEAGIRVMLPQAKECQGVPATLRNWRRQGASSPRFFRGSTALFTP